MDKPTIEPSLTWLDRAYSHQDLYGGLQSELESFHNPLSGWFAGDAYTSGNVRLLDEVHRFVEAVAQHSEPGFVQKQSLFVGVEPGWTPTDFGTIFYPLVSSAIQLQTPRLRYSPQIQQFHKTCLGLGLNNFHWPTNPEEKAIWTTPSGDKLKWQGVIAGAAVFNRLIEILRIDLASDAYKASINNRLNALKRLCKDTLDYEDSLFNSYKSIQAVSIDLAYKFPNGQQITLIEAQDHIGKLTHSKKPGAFADKVGFVRQLSYWRGSYRFRAIFFFANRNLTIDQRVTQIGKEWSETITKGNGTHCSAQFRDASTAAPTETLPFGQTEYDRTKLRSALSKLCLYENLLEASIDGPVRPKTATASSIRTITKGQSPGSKASRKS